jgi:hypothetical protein
VPSLAGSMPAELLWQGSEKGVEDWGGGGSSQPDIGCQECGRMWSLPPRPWDPGNPGCGETAVQAGVGLLGAGPPSRLFLWGRGCGQLTLAGLEQGGGDSANLK